MFYKNIAWLLRTMSDNELDNMTDDTFEIYEIMGGF